MCPQGGCALRAETQAAGSHVRTSRELGEVTVEPPNGESTAPDRRAFAAPALGPGMKRAPIANWGFGDQTSSSMRPLDRIEAAPAHVSLPSSQPAKYTNLASPALASLPALRTTMDSVPTIPPIPRKESDRPIEVRIGTIEIRAAPSSIEKTESEPGPTPRGFEDYFVVRNYMRRGW